MNAQGVNLVLWVGPTVPTPAPSMLLEAFDSVEVTHSDEGRSGFQITFQAGRSGLADLLDYRILSAPVLKPFNRIILLVTLNAVPRVLMDGFITHRQLAPSNEPGTSILSVTGEDVSLMMDMEEKSEEHPAQDETVVASKIIASYAQYGLIPLVIPPFVLDPPLPVERTPVQQDTDLGHLQTMAGRFGYVFYVVPGPAPLTNTAYWGPPIREGIPQRALSVDMGSETNVESIDFQHDTLAPATMSGRVQDRVTNQSVPVQTFASTRIPLVSQPALPTQQPHVRSSRFRESGLTATQAYARAQGTTDASMDAVVSATGELDALRYGGLLESRRTVGVRGVGYQHDGFYYVKSVTHNVRKGEYRQRFTLAREGVGALTPVVPT